jgi:hypothetical protein
MSTEPVDIKVVYQARKQRPAIRDEDGNPIKDPLEYARDKLLLPSLARTVKRGHQEPLYDLELDDGTLIPLGDAERLLNPRKVAAALLDEGVSIPTYSWPKFRPIAGCLRAIAEEQDTGATPDGDTTGWLARYAAECATAAVDLADPDQRADVLGDLRRGFYTTEPRLFIPSDRFAAWVTSALRVRMTHREMAARLQRLGFTREEVVATDRHGRRRKGRFAASPLGYDPEA